MPQMAPILWAPLLLTILFLIMMTMSYLYFETNKYSNFSDKKNKQSLNWLW